MPTKTKHTSDEYVRMFYEHQYDRMKAIEGQRWSFTNIVVSLSVLAFTFGFQNQSTLTIINGVVLPVLIAILNLFAALYVWRTLNYIRVHQQRAYAILDKYARELFELHSKHPQQRDPFHLGLSNIQLIIHILLLFPSLMTLVIYWLQ